MKILVTGAHGFIGTHLTHALQQANHTVVPTDIKGDTIVDATNYRHVIDATANIDCVYHLAAEVGRKNGEHCYERLWKTNVIGTRNILEAQRVHRFDLVFISSSEVYGDRPQRILHEDMMVDSPTTHFMNDYALSKWTGELICNRFREQFGSRILVIRPFNVYGEGEEYSPYRGVVSIFVGNALAGIPLEVYTKHTRSFIHVQDFVETLGQCCMEMRNEAYSMAVNVGGTEPVTMIELAAKVALQVPGTIICEQEPEPFNVLHKCPDVTLASKLFRHNPQITLTEGVSRVVGEAIKCVRS